MKKKISSFVKDLKSNKKLSSFDEASTKQAVVLRLLSFLEWDIFDVEEVYPNFSDDGSQVAYALRIKNKNKVFIDVKRTDEKLDNYQKQLFSFAVQQGTELLVLTNGVEWWFYISSEKGNFLQKRILTIDILDQEPDIFIPHFIDLLCKSNVSKGDAAKAAKTIHQNQKQQLAAEFLPEAWNQIVSQPNKILIEILSETTDKLSGHKPDSKVVEKFITKRLDNWIIKNIPKSQPLPAADLPATPAAKEDSKPKSQKKTAPAAVKKKETYSDKIIKSFSFNGTTYTVRAWDEMLITLCDVFASAYPQDFEKVLWISDDQKPHFTKYSDQLRIPEKIKGTNIYVETKLNPDEIVKAIGDLLLEFGFDHDDLTIKTQ